MKKNLLFSKSIKQFIAVLFLVTSISYAQVPTITSFSPTSGAVGSTVTITGTGFDSTPSNNVVLLDGMRCNVSAASTTSLSITIPKGTTNNHFQVVNKINGLSVISKLKYSVKSSTLGTQVASNSFLLNSPSSLNNIPVTNVKNYSTADIDNDGKLDILAMSNGYSLKIAATSSTPANFNYNVTTITNSVLPVSNDVRYAQLKDFNNDGLLDFMTTEPGTSTTGGWVNVNTSTSGSPNFASRISLTPSLSYNFLATDVVCADFNNDGKIDVLGGYRTDSYFTFCKNTTTGGVFSESSTRGQGASQIDLVNAMVEGDFTGDGKIDYFVTHGSIANIVTNNTTPGANSLTISVSSDISLNANILKTSDLDNDGDLDIVACNLNASAIFILTNNGSGAFTLTTNNLPSGTGTIRGIELGDLDGDGDVDLIYATSTGFYFTPNTSSSSNNISLDFASNVILNSSVTSYGFKLVDLNEDNKLDILYSTGTALNILVNKIGELPIVVLSNNSISIANCKTPRVVADHNNVLSDINLDQNDMYYNLNGTMNVPSIWALYQNTQTGGYFLSLSYGGTSGIVQTNPISVNSLFSAEGTMMLASANFPSANLPVQFNQATGAITYNGQTFQALPKYESFTVSGSNLTAGVTVTPPVNFQVSTDQSTWIGTTTTPTAITLTPSSGTVATTTVYVRTIPSLAAGSYSGTNITMASSGATNVSKAVAATLYTPTAIGTQPLATKNICINASTGNTINLVATGSSLTYQWYSNTTNSTSGGTSLGSTNGAQTATLTLSTTTAGTIYYYCVVSGSCGTVTSAVSAVTINPTTVAGTATASAITVCSGTTTTLSLTGNTGTIQWQSSSNNSTWSDISGATSASYTTSALTKTVYYKANVTSGACTLAASNAITVTVPTAPYPFDRVVNFSSTGYLTKATTSSLGLTNFTVEAWIYPTAWNNLAGIIAKQDFQLTTAASGALAFMIESSWSWELRTSATNVLTLNKWQHVAASYNASTKQMKMYVDGVLIDTYTRTQSFVPNFTTANLTVGYNNGTGNGSPSRNFAGNIDEVKVWNAVKTDTEISNNYATQLAGNETGLVAYYKFDQGIGSGNNTAITTLTDLTSNANHLTLSSSAMTMNGATNNILQIGPAILSTPSICLNTSATLTHTNTGGSWLSSDAAVISIDSSTGIATANAVGTATITYTFTDNGCTYTSTKLFTVLDLPAITAQPATTAQNICLNGTATALSVTATGAGLTYQWYKNTTASNTGGTSISGATSASYTPLSTTAGDGYYYCIVSGTCTPQVTSNVSGLIKVYAPSVAGTISSSVTSICDSGSTTLTLAGNTGTIQWQRFDNPVWTDLSGETNTTYTTSTLTQNTIYRAVVTNGSCSSVTSPQFTVQVNASPAAPTAASTVNYCLGATATALTATATTGYTLQWYTAATGGTASTTAPTPTTSAAGTTTYYVSQKQNSSTVTTSTSAGTTASYVSGLTFGQTFQVATTSRITSLAIGQIFAYSPVINVKIYNGFGGTLLGTADATMTGSGYFNPVFTFANSNIVLNANQTYYFEVTSTNSVSIYLMTVKNNYTSTGVLYQNNVANSALDFDFTLTSSSIANPCESPRTAINVNVNAVPTISGVQNVSVGGATLQLTGSDTPDATTPWVSSNASAATISSSGVVTGIAAGTTTITYTASSGCTTTTTLRVMDCTQPFGNALAFGNGTSGTLTNADSVQINSRIFPNTTVTDFTIETWYKPVASDMVTGSTWSAILGNGSGANPSLYVTNGGKIHFKWLEASVGNGFTTTNNLLTQDIWNHIAVVKTGTTIKLFINGVEKYSGTCGASFNLNNNAFTLGANDNQINGALDEVRFWSTARTQSQIQATMNTELVGNETGLLAYFDFNQGVAGGNNTSITTVTNKVNNALNGTLTSFAKTGTASNFVANSVANLDIVGAAAICANSTSQYTHPISGGTWAVSNGANATVSSTGLVTSAANENITLSYTYTINGCSFTATKAISINTPTAPVTTTTVNLCQGATATALTATATTGNTLQWYTVSTGGTASTTAPTPSTTTLGTITYYVSQKNTTPTCESTRTAIAVTVNSLPTISGVQTMSVGGATLQLTGSGTPDATTPWTSSTPSVATISSSGVVTAVGGGTTTITYLTASGCTATAVISVVDCSQPFGNALNFDGVNDYVVLDNVGTNTSLQFANTTNYTLEAWVKRNAVTSSSAAIIAKQNGNVAGNYSLGISATGMPYLSREAAPWAVTATTSLPLNEWHHIAGVFDGSSLKIYIDGVLNNSVTTSGSITPSTVTAIKVAIGAMYTNSSPSNFFNGSIDEARIWNVAKTATQIQQAKDSALNGNETGLVGYYNFNHGIADGNNTAITSIVNSVNSASNGTLTNFTKTGTTSNFVGSVNNIDIVGAVAICANSTSQYTHQVSGGTWAVSNGANATVSSTGLVTSAANENITLSYTYTINGCSFTATKAVSIDTPTAPVATTTVNLCQGTTATALTATATTGTTLKWYTVPTGGTASTTAPIPSTTIAGSTSYYVSQVNTTSGCESPRTTITAVVNPLPVVTGNVAIEVGASTTLTATTTAASSNAWTSSNTSVATVNNSGVVTAVAPGTTVITYTNSTGCSATKNITVTVGITQTPTLTHPASNITGATTFRVNYTLPESPLSGSVRLIFTPVSGGSSVVWNMVNATSVDFNYTVTSQPNATYVTSGTALSYGTYNVTLSYQDIYSSPAASATNTSIQTLAPPSISFTQSSYTGLVNVAMVSIVPTNTGGTISSYSISPALPNGLVFNTTNGTISGTPSATRAATNYTITATNAAGSDAKIISLFVDADSDGDGVPDSVEIQQGTNPNVPGARDTDGDGVPDYIEIQQGTNPNVPGALDTDGDGVPDYIEIQQGTNPNVPGAKDTDGDGVPDYIELQQGTNPNVPGAKDTDGDGVPDYVELQQGTNPNVPGARDTDGDGVPDYVELQQGTNPNVPGALDTDGDGVPDYVELQQGTNPNVPGARDTDGDGVPDYVELQQGTNPSVPGDRLIDTDGDGIPDYIEIRLGTNPNVADATDSDNDGISNYKEGYNYSNPSASLDTDRDGIPNYLDLDSDGDGILDRNDAFPINRLEWKDTDHDGIGDNADTDDDNDGILDACDSDINGDHIPDNGTDMDSDGIIDSCDTDRDGDGVNNTSDNCPDKPNRDQADRDHDGLGDVCDTIELNTTQAITPNGDGINDTWVIYNLVNHPGSTVRVFNTNGVQVFYSTNYQNDWAGNYQGSSEMLPVGSYLYQIDLGSDGTIDEQGWLYLTK